MWSPDPDHLFCTFLITWRKGANSSTYDNKNLIFDIRSFRYVHKYLLWKWLHSYYCIYLLWIWQRSSCCLDDIFTYSFVSGLSMVTHKVFSYTLSRLGIPSHGICQNSENIQCTMQEFLLASGFSNQLSQDQNVISYNSGKIRNLEHTVT